MRKLTLPLELFKYLDELKFRMLMHNYNVSYASLISAIVYYCYTHDECIEDILENYYKYIDKIYKRRPR